MTPQAQASLEGHHTWKRIKQRIDSNTNILMELKLVKYNTIDTIQLIPYK